MTMTSSITAKCEDGKFKAIYCHCDGSLIWVGKLLFKYYNSQEKIEALIAFGDIYTLNKTTECPERHCLDYPVENCTVFYGRDSNEADSAVEAFEADTYEEILEEAEQTYNYLWNGEKWLIDGPDIKMDSILSKELKKI